MSSHNGCLHYVHGTVQVNFEPSHVGCDYCPVLETYARKQCRLTGEYLIDTRTTGCFCPLNLDYEEINK